MPLRYNLSSDTIDNKMTTAVNSSSSNNNNNNNNSLSTFDLCRDTQVAICTMTITYLWFATNVAYYGMSIALSRISDDIYLSIVYLTMLQAPAYFFTGYIF